MGARRGRLFGLIGTIREAGVECLSPEIGIGDPLLPTLGGDALVLLGRKSICHFFSEQYSIRKSRNGRVQLRGLRIHGS